MSRRLSLPTSGSVDVRRTLAAFWVLTGYTVILSEDLSATIYIDHDKQLVKIRGGLDDDHLIACLEAACAAIGAPRAREKWGPLLDWLAAQATVED